MQGGGRILLFEIHKPMESEGFEYIRRLMLRWRSKTMKQAMLAVLFLTLAGCGQAPKPEQAQAPPPAAANTAAPYLLSLNPIGTTESVAFNKQPDGSSAFAVNGKGFV